MGTQGRTPHRAGPMTLSLSCYCILKAWYLFPTKAKVRRFFAPGLGLLQASKAECSVFLQEPQHIHALGLEHCKAFLLQCGCESAKVPIGTLSGRLSWEILFLKLPWVLQAVCFLCEVWPRVVISFLGFLLKDCFSVKPSHPHGQAMSLLSHVSFYLRSSQRTLSSICVCVSLCR